MQVMSHRGYWKLPEEKNTIAAFKRSFELGFGTETDVRDLDGELVISHDPPRRGAMPLRAFFDALGGCNLPLAINIKSDGLASALKAMINECGISNYFVFDMSVPDMRSYRDLGIPYLTRISEVEPTPTYSEDAAGVWLDAFNQTWYDETLLERLLNSHQILCVVSPELHRRPHLDTWNLLRHFRHRQNLMLCTDLPEEAQIFFKETT